jgi:hypothetical protein
MSMHGAIFFDLDLRGFEDPNENFVNQSTALNPRNPNPANLEVVEKPLPLVIEGLPVLG